MRVSFTELDRTQLVAAVDHVIEAGVTSERCHRELENVQKGLDAHPQVTIAHVYGRLAVVVARLQTAQEQLADILGRVQQAVQEGATL